MNVVNSGNLRPLKAGWRSWLALMWLAAAGPAMPLPGHSAPSEERLAAAPSAAVTMSATSPLKPGLRVALYRGPGTGGKGPPNLKQQLNDGTRSSVREVSPEEIRGGVLTNYDVVIFAGGSGSKQAEAIGEAGREAVRQFVGHGGGYVGICAGAFLATSGFTWSLHLIDAKTVSPKWKRGRGDVKVELTDKGLGILGDRAGEFDVHYANGPIVQPAKEPSLTPYVPLAFFRSEMASNDVPVGVMVNAPAIFAGDYKQGRVVCLSPHPEQTPGLEGIMPKVVAWVAPQPGRANK
jgi:putative intracellular protease/amidase